MNITNSTMKCAYNLVENYAKFDSLSECYDLKIEDIPEIDLEELAFHLYLDNPDSMVEATGPDNKQYEKNMMPTLLEYLKNAVDEESRIEFLTAWREGMVSYVKKTMNQVLGDALEYYNKEDHLVA